MSSDSDQKDRLVNQSHILYDSGASSYRTYSNTVGIPIVGPVIRLEKSTNECEVVPGKAIQYKIVVRNKGSLAAKVVLYDELPEGTAFVPNSVSIDGVPLPGADLEAGLRLGDIGPSDKIKVVFQLVLLPGEGGACDNVTRVRNRAKAKVSFRSSSGRHVKETVHSNTVSLPVAKADKPLPFARLSVDPTRAGPSDRLRYTMFVGNEGHVAASITLLSFIPKGTLYIRNSLTIDGKWVSGGGSAGAEIPLGLLKPGDRITVVWEVSVPGISIVTPGQQIDNCTLLRADYWERESVEHFIKEFESNKVSVELCFPVVSAKLKAKPEMSYPEGCVEFTMILSNIGNRSALCVAEKLLTGPIHYVPGSMRVDGEAVPEPGGGERFEFGKLEPSSHKKVYFQGKISPLVTTRSLRGHILVQYEYHVNEKRHVAETVTNSYVISIMYDDE